MDTLAIEMRRARRDDVAAIVRLLADDELGKQRERYEDPLPDSYYRAFEVIDADPHQALTVVEANGEVIGTLHLTFLPSLSYQGGTRALIEAVRVDSRYRSHGIGQQLFEWAIAEAKAKGCIMVQLTTDARRPDAQRFYERLGFAPSHVGMKLHLR